MATGLKRYEFSERLADILGESRRDLRSRVTLLVSSGLVPPGPRGRGSPPATPDYAAKLLLGAMAAPQQTHTVAAIRCYERLRPTVRTADAAAPRVTLGPHCLPEKQNVPPSHPLLAGHRSFGEVLARLLEFAGAAETRKNLARELFGIWVSRSYPVCAVQLGTWTANQRRILTQRYELAEGARPPAWLDPEQDGNASPGLYQTVFLPASKLIEIGLSTSLTDESRSPMINLGPKMARIQKLAGLVRQNRFRGRWEKLLEALASVQSWSDQVDTRDSRLIEVRDFGSNPGQLRMLKYVPHTLPTEAPLVVLLHGCTQTAASFDKGTGWSTLADRLGFALLLPEQHWGNNPLRCFNWFRPEDTRRESGEALSINQMIHRMIDDHRLDRRQVFVTGLSSGGAMTSVMLATYPEVFAGGAVLSGVPYRTADGMQEAFESIFQGRSRSAREWGDLVRQASPHQGPWPKVSVWHGDADTAVKPSNADETLKQWTDVHGVDGQPHMESSVDGHLHRVWHGADGERLVESFTIRGMPHGAALSTGDQAHQCGTAAPFFNDVGISSAHHIAEFWGLLERELQTSAATTTSDEVPPSVAHWTADAAVEATTHGGLPGDATVEPSVPDVQADKIDESPESEARGVFVGSSEHGVLSTDIEPDEKSSGFEMGGNAPLGIDVHGIVRKSLAAAGLVTDKETRSGGSHRGSGLPFGIDVPGIIETSLEAAGVLRGQPAASHPKAPARGVDDSGWEGEGWELLADDPAAFRDGPLLFGQVSSGYECDVGKKVRKLSRKVALGPRPELSYVRRLRLNAAVNDYTSASFSVLIDGLPVDEATAVGMEHVEAEWLQRSDIDLAQFADQTVTLTFEVTANSNVCSEVSAKAWVDRVQIKSVSPLY